MMGRQDRDQKRLFYAFNLDEVIPKSRLLRRINVFVTAVLGDRHEQLEPFYSDIGRPSVDPELMIRMLLVGYCYGIRSERQLCQEVMLHLAFRWFCKLDLEDKIPHHSTFSVNRLGRFQESCHRQCEIDPIGNLNLTHRMRWFLREGGADVEGGGADGVNCS